MSRSWNGSRDPGPPAGFYESWFLRANAPDGPRAFWIRYTTFRARKRPETAIGEIWAALFDGTTRQAIAVRREFPHADCRFDRSDLSVQIGEATLGPDTLSGSADSDGHRIEWELGHEGGGTPLLLLPEGFYDGPFPRAKAVVPAPGATFDGSIVLDGESIAIDRWTGSQNHNWGSAHTDRYAWGQVAGFEGMPEAFLECASARLKVGPVPLPWLTVAVLRVGEREWRFDRPGQALAATQRVGDREWRFETASREGRLTARIAAPEWAFVDLRYLDPRGGQKRCLNSKIASATIRLEPTDGEPLELTTDDRAAFELLD